MVSELFRQIPGVDAGFEIGVLMCASPRDFPALQPYAEHMLWGWGIDRATLERCCDTDDFVAFYAALQQHASVLRPGTRMIFDKTPRYSANLAACMGRLNVPFILVYKDPRSTVYSDFKGSGAPAFQPWFETYYADKLGYMRLHYDAYQRCRAGDRRVCLVRLEDLCLNTRATCERMFAHVGATFIPAYANMTTIRYANTRNGSVCAGVPFEHVTGLNASACRMIKDVFAEFSDWFYD
jgi:hypothetical protein